MAIYSREQRAALLWKIPLCSWRSLPGLCQWIFLALGFTSSWEHLPSAAMPARSLWAHFSWQWGFVIRSVLKLLGAKSWSSWRRERPLGSLRVCNVNVSVQVKGSRKYEQGGSILYLVSRAWDLHQTSAITHLWETLFSTPVYKRKQKILSLY